MPMLQVENPRRAHTVRRVVMRSGGYDQSGKYWGAAIGGVAPLYEVVDANGDVIGHVRAPSRAAAVQAAANMVASKRTNPTKGKGGGVAKRKKMSAAEKAAFKAKMAAGRAKAARSAGRKPQAAAAPNRKKRRASKARAVAVGRSPAGDVHKRTAAPRAPAARARRRAWNKGKKFSHVKRIGAYAREPEVSAHQRHVNPKKGGTMARRRKRRKNPVSAGTLAARSNPRRRRKASYRRRRNPNDVVAQVGTIVAGGATGIGVGYLADAYGSRYVANPLWRSLALVVGGFGIGSLVGRKRPDLGVALGVGIAGAGMTRGAAKYIPTTAALPAGAAPKQLAGVYDNMMGGVADAPSYPSESRSARADDARLSY